VTREASGGVETKEKKIKGLAIFDYPLACDGSKRYIFFTVLRTTIFVFKPGTKTF
jgi:hypothetical protein